MPATYSHKGKGSADYKPRTSIFQKPEPPKMYSIGGLSVDEATYRKYNREDYQLGDGALRNLRGVMLYAESAELAAEYPETAEAAKKIIAEITAEITGKGAENTMNTPKTATDYLNALHDVYAESRAAYDEAANKLEKVREFYETCESDYKKDSSPYNLSMLDVAKAKLNIAQDEYRAAYKELNADYTSKRNALRTEFEEYLSDHYSASPDKLDGATMQLLSTGICTAADLSRLATRHKDNPTMLRIIGSHAKKMYKDPHLSDDDSRILAAVQNVANKATGKEEMDIFKAAEVSLAYGIGDNYRVATKMHSTVEGKWGGFLSDMAEASGSSAATAE